MDTNKKIRRLEKNILKLSKDNDRLNRTVRILDNRLKRTEKELYNDTIFQEIMVIVEGIKDQLDRIELGQEVEGDNVGDS